MRKRITSLFLVLALCLTLLPTTALAEEAGAAQETQDSIEVGDGYTIEEDTAVQGKGENDKAVQTVQALIDALPAAEDISGRHRRGEAGPDGGAGGPVGLCQI